MRVLLDACVPKRLARLLVGYEVSTAQEMGWGDLDNGDLLDAMAAQFAALITTDRGIPHQQHIASRPIGVLVLRGRSNRLADLVPLVPGALRQLPLLKPGTVVVIDG